jgi:hypothetical protein
MATGHSEQSKPFLLVIVSPVNAFNCKHVRERRACDLERDAMVPLIERRLFVIPFKVIVLHRIPIDISLQAFGRALLARLILWFSG